jgi:hypothetical protein
MNNTTQTKPQLIEIDHKSVAYTKKRYNQPQKGFKPQEDLSNPRQYPLEMQPVLDAVVEYSRRTFALGLLTGAEEIEKTIEYINTLDPKNAQVSQIINFLSERAAKLRTGFDHGYGM